MPLHRVNHRPIPIARTAAESLSGRDFGPAWRDFGLAWRDFGLAWRNFGLAWRNFGKRSPNSVPTAQ